MVAQRSAGPGSADCSCRHQPRPSQERVSVGPRLSCTSPAPPESILQWSLGPVLCLSSAVTADLAGSAPPSRGSLLPAVHSVQVYATAAQSSPASRTDEPAGHSAQPAGRAGHCSEPVETQDRCRNHRVLYLRRTPAATRPASTGGWHGRPAAGPAAQLATDPMSASGRPADQTPTPDTDTAAPSHWPVPTQRRSNVPVCHRSRTDVSVAGHRSLSRSRLDDPADHRSRSDAVGQVLGVPTDRLTSWLRDAAPGRPGSWR